jgi:hypothetical protein
MERSAFAVACIFHPKHKRGERAFMSKQLKLSWRLSEASEGDE